MKPGGQRFIAKVWRHGSRGVPAVWGVYDRERASWPGFTAELGAVQQRLKSEGEAQEEAARLEGVINA